jgi:TetR/AcrR family transcriptional repressor of nem operon
MEFDMSDIAIAILDAAERRIRRGGFNGFSFREIAADVGVKSSSVHYHFPTKENLAAAVVRRYTDEVIAYIDREAKSESDPVKLWTRAFRGTLTDEHMCPCIAMAAGTLDLPAVVASEVQHFFRSCLEKMIEQGLSEDSASEILSTITGAMVVANSLGDVSTYDRAICELMRERMPPHARADAAGCLNRRDAVSSVLCPTPTRRAAAARSMFVAGH